MIKRNVLLGGRTSEWKNHDYTRKKFFIVTYIRKKSGSLDSYFFFSIYISHVYVMYPYNLMKIGVADRNIVAKILLSLFVNFFYT